MVPLRHLPFRPLLAPVLLATLFGALTVTAQDQLEDGIAPGEALTREFDASVANSSALVRAVRESLRQYELLRQRRKHSRVKRAAKRVCYGELGCFEDSGPFAYLEMLPSPPEEINTKFYFYSTKNRSDRPLMELPFLQMTDAFRNSRSLLRKRQAANKDDKAGDTGDNETAPMATDPPASGTGTGTGTASTAKKNLFTKVPFTIDDLVGFDEMSVRIIVHGFGSACPHVWIYEMKTALMAVEDCIVICVDWENGATFPNYVRAATNTRLVGKQLAMLINNLREHKGLNLNRTHIIGFSLGAHVSGFAGAELPGLARITGLDPAGPLFEAQHPKVRLDNTDARFVDVIHSNGENLILGGLGSWQPMGHVDFYPNGGRVQNGCSNLFVGAVTDFIWSAQAAEDEEGRSLCNHRRAYKFFIDSVAPRCLFPAFPCASYDDFLKGKCFPCAQNEQDLAAGVPRCSNMGYYADRSNGRGQLYLVTREEEPFCAHQFQLQIFNSFNDLPLRTIGRLEATLEGEGGLNETFQISEKDDSEFLAGDIVSKIIVPHPALGFPTTLSLNYKPYSGWLSKGLPHWDIDKVVLTDSFGRSHSLCRPSTKLSSGKPVRLELRAGNCELENQEDYGVLPVHPSTDGPADSDGQESLLTADVESAEATPKKRKDLLSSGPLEESEVLLWQPLFEGNALDREGAGESSRGLHQPEPVEIFEPVLSDRRSAAANGGRNLPNAPVTEEIMEPVLKATTPRAKKGKELELEAGHEAGQTEMLRITTVSGEEGAGSAESEEGAGQNVAITVQLFPFRLGDLLQRAERYARETLLPLISIQAPRFFGFNLGTSAAGEAKEEPRRPRYIPRYEQMAFLNSTRATRRPAAELGPDDRSRTSRERPSSSEARDQRNIFQLLRPETPAPGQEQPSPTDALKLSELTSYYTNALVAESRSLRPEEPTYEPVFIDLPTYRPPLTGHSRTSRAAPFTSSNKERLRRP